MRNEKLVSRWVIAAALLTTGLSMMGCGKKKAAEKSGAKTAEQKGATGDKGQARPAPEQLKVNIPVNADLEKAVKAAAAACKPNDLRNCAEFKTAKKLYDTQGKELDMFLSALVLMTRPDPKVATMAAETLSDGYSKGLTAAYKALNAAPSKLPKALALKIYANLPNIKTTRVAALMGKIAGLTGTTNEFMAAATKMPKNGGWFAWTGARYFMAWARMKSFDAVKAVANKKGLAAPRRSWLAAALSAPANMYKWTKAEYQAICPWAAKYLLSDDLDAAQNAGQIVVNCGKNFDESYIDKLLAAGKKRITEKPQTWKRPVDFPFRNPCFGGLFGGLKRGVKAAIKGKKDDKTVSPVCAKVYDFLAWSVAQPKVSDEMKDRAISWITYQERSQKALKWLKKLAKSKDKVVAAAAKKQIDYIKKHYKK